MWNQLIPADIDRVKETLGARRAETTARQAEEVKSLEARHAEEIHSLNAKEAEIELLNKLINDFTREFMQGPVAPLEPTATHNEALAETTIADTGNAGVPSPENKATASSPNSSTDPAPAPGPLQVQYPSSNFGRVRKFG